MLWKITKRMGVNCIIVQGSIISIIHVISSVSDYQTKPCETDLIFLVAGVLVERWGGQGGVDLVGFGTLRRQNGE